MYKRLRIPPEYKSRLVGKRGFICQRCKKRMFDHMHHVNVDPSDNRPENVLLVCEECHITLHFQLLKEKGKKFSTKLLRDKDDINYYFELVRKNRYERYNVSHIRKYENEELNKTYISVTDEDLYNSDVEYKP